MAKKKVQEDEEMSVQELMEVATPFIETLAPRIVEYQKVKAPLIKRNQTINFTVMMSIIISISVLAYFKIIDGSAATGLIGAIIGYVFGGLYNSSNKR